MKTVIIIAGGKSIREEWLNNGLFDMIQGNEIWSLNFAYKTMSYLPTRQVWVDDSFANNYYDDLMALDSKGVTLTTKLNGINRFKSGMTQEERAFIKRIIVYPASRNIEKSRHEDEIYYGRHGMVGAFALAIALLEQYEQIYCLGYDYGSRKHEDKDTHYYQGFIKAQSSGMGNPAIYLTKADVPNQFLSDFNYFESGKDKIYNVINPRYESHLEVFPKITYEQFYEQIGADINGFKSSDGQTMPTV